jgi:phosphoglycerate dehydrogenase-like enzyme
MKVVTYDPYARDRGLEAALAQWPDVTAVITDDVVVLARELPGAEVLITGNRSYLPDVAQIIRDGAQGLKWIQFTTSGIDKAIGNGLPAGVIVTNCAGARAFSVAEHALFLMLAVARNVRATEQARVAKHWCRDDVTPSLFNLCGKRLVIIGLGAIGQEIARKAKAFDMHVTGVSRSVTALPNFDDLQPRDNLVTACAGADIVVMAAVLDDTTAQLMSRAAIDAMAPNAVFVNIGRGGLVDEPALIAALQEGRIGGAGLDVTAVEPLPVDHPFWQMPQVIVTPHTAGAGSEPPGGSVLPIVVDNLMRWRAGQPLTKIVIERT